MQGVRGRQHMRARQAEEQVQGVRGYQGWLRDAAALGAASCNHDRPALRLSSRRIARARRLNLGGRLAARSCEAHSARRRTSGSSVLLVPLCHLSGRVGIHLHITLPRLGFPVRSMFYDREGLRGLRYRIASSRSVITVDAPYQLTFQTHFGRTQPRDCLAIAST